MPGRWLGPAPRRVEQWSMLLPWCLPKDGFPERLGTLGGFRTSDPPILHARTDARYGGNGGDYDISRRRETRRAAPAIRTSRPGSRSLAARRERQHEDVDDSGLVEVRGETHHCSVPGRGQARLVVVVGDPPRPMMGEAPDLAGQDVHGDDLLAVRMPGRDLVAGVRRSAVERVTHVFGRDEGPVPEGASRDGRDVAEVAPGWIPKEKLVPGQRLLLSLVQAGGVVRDIRTPKAGLTVAIMRDHVVAPVGRRGERSVIAAEGPEDGGSGSYSACRVVQLPARALTDAAVPNQATVETDDVLPVRG